MIWLWAGFILLILALLALDLGVFHRRVHAIGMGEALAWSAFWITLALGFNVAVFFIYEHNWMGGSSRPYGCWWRAMTTWSPRRARSSAWLAGSTR